MENSLKLYHLRLGVKKMNFPELPVKVAISVAESVITNTDNGSTKMMTQEKAFTILLEELCESKKREVTLSNKVTELENQIALLLAKDAIKDTLIEELSDNAMFVKFI